MGGTRQVVVVGAGFISALHLEALQSVSSAEVTAIVDTNERRAKAVAEKYGVARVGTSVDDVTLAGGCDVAHVIVPPDHHHAVTAPLLRAGIHVLLEKPMCTTVAECDDLIKTAKKGNAVLAINQNGIFHPAHQALKRKLDGGEFGNLVSLFYFLNLPLRQLSSRQYGHWMFQEPKNIVLEQIIHPLSQIADLAGKTQSLQSFTGKPMELGPGMKFYETWQVSMHCERAKAQLYVSLGQDFPTVGIVAISSDGALMVDMQNNRICGQTATAGPEFLDSFSIGLTMSSAMGWQACRNLMNYVLSTLRLRPRSDPFFVGLRDSVAAFHHGLEKGKASVSGQFGRDLVADCHKIAKRVAPRRAPSKSKTKKTKGEKPAETPVAPPTRTVAVLGGTGFIGTALVKRLHDAGLGVRVMARNTRALATPFHQQNVEVVAGDTAVAEDVKRAIGDAKIVINLSHGGGGDDWEAVEKSMVGGAETVAECCLRNKVERLIHVGTIAALYLGDPDEVVTGETGVDPEFATRGIYARGKAVCDRLLLDLHASRGLPVTILRPGVVVGSGGLPFHSGLGLFHRDRHCLGWNNGRNALPFVLVEDVAEAIYLAIDADGIVGNAFNIVGDVRLTAREYIAELARTLRRPIQFHPQTVIKQQVQEIGYWLVKRAIDRDVSFPSQRDLVSRGMRARFDCSDAKTALNWQPEDDRDAFIARGIDVYGKAG